MKKINICFVIILLNILPLKSKSQYSILYSFGDSDGLDYSNNARDVGFVSDGTFLYGIARYGGTNNDVGAIFKMKFDSTNITYLHEFLNDTAGIRPYGSLLLSNDTLYGVSTNGGKNEKGTIFKLKTDGAGFTKLFDFKDTTTGIFPESPLILYNNVLYGKTQGGGWANGSCIYKINKDGSAFSQIKTFNAPLNGPVCGNLVLKDNYLYASTCNTIFKINLVDTTYHELINQNLLNPRGIILTDSLIYCAAMNKIFSINFDGLNYKQIFDFSGNTTLGNLCLFDSTLYGFASGGNYGQGVIYEVKIDGTKYKKLFDFYSTLDVTGACPSGYLYYKDNTLYGLTYMRETMHCYGGNIFKFKLNNQIQTKNITFNNITSNSVDIKWEKGNGMKRVVFIKKGTNLIPSPIDFWNYQLSLPSNNNNATGNYCVYNDTGSFVTVNNLQSDTIYTVHSFEYWFIKNGSIPVYYDIDTTLNPTTFWTLFSDINENASNTNSLRIYPNPVSALLTIETEQLTKEGTVTIININGQELIRQRIKNSTTQIDINKLTSGIYFVKLVTNKIVEVRKIIKE